MVCHPEMITVAHAVGVDLAWGVGWKSAVASSKLISLT